MINNKNRILRLLKFLYNSTDEQHTLTTKQAVAMFSDSDGAIDRKTVRADIETLLDEGYDIVNAPGRANAYFMASREFELPELKILIDAVSASPFISRRKSEELIGKLMGLASESQAQGLVRHLYTADTVRSASTSLFYSVDTINDAINAGRQVRFRYRSYSPNKEKGLRRAGKEYVNSPYGLVWNDDHYYMIGWSEEHSDIVQFRVDRMVKPVMTQDEAVPAPEGFSISGYVQSKFGMYGGTDTALVTLECANDCMDYIIDRFGENVSTRIIDDGHFRVQAEVSLSPNFYAEIFKFSPDIRITGPDRAVKEFRAMLRAAGHQDTAAG